MDKKKIKAEFADKLMAKYKENEIARTTKYWHENDINYEGVYLIIKPLHGCKNIEIMYDGNHVSEDEIIISYSHWHTHCYNYFPEGAEENYSDYFVEHLSEYINGILQGKDMQTL